MDARPVGAVARRLPRPAPAGRRARFTNHYLSQ